MEDKKGPSTIEEDLTPDAKEAERERMDCVFIEDSHPSEDASEEKAATPPPFPANA